MGEVIKNKKIKQEENGFAEIVTRFVISGLLRVEISLTEGKANTRNNKNKILSIWFSRSLKQRIFPKALTPVIEAFLHTYKKKPLTADLTATLDEIGAEYKLCKMKFKDFINTEKERLNSALDELKKQNWHPTFPLIHDPVKNGPYITTQKKEIFSLDVDYNDAFAKGILIKPLDIFVCGALDEVCSAFYENGLLLEKVNATIFEGQHHALVKVYPKNDYHGTLVIPKKLLLTNSSPS